MRLARRLLAGVIGIGPALVVPALPAVAQTDQAVSTGCGSVLTAAWHVPGKTYRVSTMANGRTCATANVLLTIRAPDGAIILKFASAAADLPLLFSEVRSPTAMTIALRRWIRQLPASTTRDLPPWNTDDLEPKRGEMPFHPEPSVTREHYQELRKWAQPRFCFVQGSESEACYALDPKTDTLTLVGSQMLPG